MEKKGRKMYMRVDLFSPLMFWCSCKSQFHQMESFHVFTAVLHIFSKNNDVVVFLNRSKIIKKLNTFTCKSKY